MKQGRAVRAAAGSRRPRHHHLPLRAVVAIRPVSPEDGVTGVFTRISPGEADAGIVYASDVGAAVGEVDGVDIPASQNVRAICTSPRVAASEHGEAAQAFIDLVLPAAGRQTLLEAGSLSPADE